jgi:hypothetical protein
MTDAELLDKFRGVALPLMEEEQVKGVADGVLGLDRLNDIGELMATLKI